MHAGEVVNCWGLQYVPFFCDRSRSVVPEVWVRRESLVAEDSRACDRLRALQPRLLQPLQSRSADGRQRDEDIFHQVLGGATLHPVRPRWGCCLTGFPRTDSANRSPPLTHGCVFGALSGEDRWLCTLLLKQGWRVEYNAASDAYTNAPEDFKELYNQVSAATCSAVWQTQILYIKSNHEYQSNWLEVVIKLKITRVMLIIFLL